MKPIERMAYDVGQAARIAWFLAHYRLAQRRIERVVTPAPVEGALPSRDAMMRDLFSLFARDRAAIEAGHYRLPPDLLVDPRAAWRASRAFLTDLDEVNRRRLEGAHQEVNGKAPARHRYPRYYLQNFHFQTDGWLSEHSAELYDFQVEVLFNGGADAMRRQALVPLAKFLRGRRIADQPLLDVACGNGRFLNTIKHTWPRLPVTGLDLSRPYLGKARRHLERWSWARLVEGAAERLPFADRSFAVVTCIYLFHELPRKIRKAAAAEMARVLRPGGLLLLADSFQRGDRPEFEGLLELFPRAYHEPYFADYTRHDLTALFEEHGLAHQGSDIAYMTKVMAFEKPAAAGRPNGAAA